MKALLKVPGQVTRAVRRFGRHENLFVMGGNREMASAVPRNPPPSGAHDLVFLPMPRCAALALLVAGVGAALSTVPARAQARYVNLTLSTQYDDNLQRLPSEQKALQPHSGQEITTRIGAGAGVVAELGLIDLRVDGSVAKRLFAYNDELNTDEYQLAGRADYQALSGAATLEALVSRENLAFNDPIFRGTSVRDLIRFAAEGDRRLIGNIRLAGSASFQSSSSPDAILSRADNDRYSYSVGLSYVSPLENRLEIGYSESIAEGGKERTIVVQNVPIFYSSDATNRSAYGEVEYAPSVLLSVTARAGYTWHNDRSVLDADFQGLTHAASVTWSPRESLAIVAATSRSFSSNDELFANGVKSSTFSLSVRGEAFQRVTITARARHTERNFRYDLQADTPTVTPRSDQFLVLEAHSQYQTGIGIAVGLQLRHTVVEDTAAEETIRDNSVMLTLSRTFEL